MGIQMEGAWGVRPSSEVVVWNGARCNETRRGTKLRKKTTGEQTSKIVLPMKGCSCRILLALLPAGLRLRSRCLVVYDMANSVTDHRGALAIVLAAGNRISPTWPAPPSAISPSQRTLNEGLLHFRFRF
ncbi:hypothetical protein H6P81_000978 [Aristolochia fimbriata]|uniref:Uncharacterized protein n=1 Tax=Aristolochia fimbriata TaxID=158543 RepID=A0AAV7F5L2_ARIFI|nr:hypothetical protein H6P81_000978 [Aristolochia fimbriata]